MTMNIYDLLQNTDAKIILGNRWLVLRADKNYVVCEEKPIDDFFKTSRIIIETVQEEKAINALLNGRTKEIKHRVKEKRNEFTRVDKTNASTLLCLSKNVMVWKYWC